MTSEKIGFAVGDNGLLLSTKDGGLHWYKRQLIENETLHSIYFSSPKKGIIVGDNGTIFSSTNEGKSWEKEVSGTNQSLRNVFILHDTLAWASGENGTLILYNNMQPLYNIIPDFIIEKENTMDMISWKSEFEKNNKCFNLERGKDSIRFEPIKSIVSKAKNGNSNVPIDYTLIDEKPMEGINYYRLTQTDLDGRTAISSPIKSIYWEPHVSKIVVNYDPSNYEIEILYDIKLNSVLNIKLLDESGRIMKESTTIANNGANVQKMDITLENEGEYKLEVRIDNDLITSKGIKK
jgi:hypothetical protein